VNTPIVSFLPLVDVPVEVVERKGLGHPDTICDALAEALSRALCREYLQKCGVILHHNVDKALLCGGRAAPQFGGGTVLAPIEIYLAGRAVAELAGGRISIGEIAVETARLWLKSNLHDLDAECHVRVHPRIQPGSLDLQALFSSRAKGGVTLANDTSIGVGHAPASPLERLALAIEKRMNGRDRLRQNPAWGEDIKVMAFRRGKAVDVTVACAMIGRHLRHIDDYRAEKAAIAELARELAAAHGFAVCDVAVNSADDPGSGRIYLTVTGTSAEAGDDGQVGRGNRVNGLITPCRPMSLEAAAGKNPVSHVGKIYNVVAQHIAEALAASADEITGVECLMVSKIGAPITEPAIVHIKLAVADGAPTARLRERAAATAADHIGRIPHLTERFAAGTIEIY
jgi:S-adenosylmethionine synthetase